MNRTCVESTLALPLIDAAGKDFVEHAFDNKLVHPVDAA